MPASKHWVGKVNLSQRVSLTVNDNIFSTFRLIDRIFLDNFNLSRTFLLSIFHNCRRWMQLILMRRTKWCITYAKKRNKRSKLFINMRVKDDNLICYLSCRLLIIWDGSFLQFRSRISWLVDKRGGNFLFLLKILRTIGSLLLFRNRTTKDKKQVVTRLINIKSLKYFFQVVC